MTDMRARFTRRGFLAVAALAPAAAFTPLAPAARAADGAAALALAYPRALGDLEVVAISDGYLEYSGPLFLNISEEDLAESLTTAFLDPALPTRTGVTAHLLRGGGRTTLIDAGAAEAFGPTLGRLPATLAALDCAPEDVDEVLLTHLHIDHCGGLLAAGAPAFPNARLHVAAAELAFWTDPAIASRAPEHMRPFFERAAATVAAYGDRVSTFGPEAEVLPGVKVAPLPGHTVGHSGFLIDGGGETLLVFGDAANSAAVQFPHPEASLVFDTDPAQAASSRRRLFDMAAADGLLCAGTHMPFPGVGHVLRVGEAYEWAPEEWRY